MSYFLQKAENKTDKLLSLMYEKTKHSIKDRTLRTNSKFNFPVFMTGDIIVIIFWKRNILYRFEGICISLKKKGLIKPDVSFILRNIILGVGIEFIVSYFYNRVYRIQFSDYKRKNFLYLRSKLYYLRLKINRQSRVFD